MATKASLLPDLLDHLKVNLETRLSALAASTPDPTLAEVLVHTAIQRLDEAGEAIEFGDVATDSDADWATFGDLRREEEGRLGGLIWIVVPGSGEEVIKQSRDRAFALFHIVAQELRANPGQGYPTPNTAQAVRVAAIARFQFLQAPLDTGRLAQIKFVIEYKGRLPI